MTTTFAHVASIALLCVAPAIAVGAQELPAPLSPKQSVVAAYVPIMKFATFYVAKARGLFDKHGLDVKVERVKSGTEVIAFLTQGKVDVGGIAIVASTWNAWAKRVDMRIVAPGALEPTVGSSTMLLVRKDLRESGKVRQVADLRGMKLAMAGGPGSGGEYLVAKALERGTLTIRDVQSLNLGNADMPAALAKRFVLALIEAARLMQGADYLAPENLKARLTHVNTTEQALRAGDPVTYDPNQAPRPASTTRRNTPPENALDTAQGPG